MLAFTVNVDPVTLLSPVKLVQRNVGDGFPLAEQRMTVPPATVDPLVTPDNIITSRGQSTDKLTSLSYIKIIRNTGSATAVP